MAIRAWFRNRRAGDDPPAEASATGGHRNKFGTFAGVFTPTILTILGAIMFLRQGWVVGNAGLVGTIVIILLAHIITICTGLAVSSIATNTRVGAGGAFAIISGSLGMEVGGSVGIPLYLAQGISVAFYVLAFAEGWVGLYPTHPFVLVAFVAYTGVFLIAYSSAQFAARIQFVIMAILAVSIVSIALGTFPIGTHTVALQSPQYFGNFASASFWKTFAIYFPAVTGIMAGISMSGSLRDPRRALPIGTMSAIVVGLVVYIAVSYWFAIVATPAELLDTTRVIMADKAYWDWAIYAGLLGATISSALGSIVAAPRVLQALAASNLLPRSEIFARENAKGDPRPATLTTGLTGLLALAVSLAAGGLDAVADILTMFFLITYAMLNVVVLIEQTLATVSFRPTFRIPRIIPFIGVLFCTFTMLLVNPTFTLIATIVVLVIYALLSRRNLDPSPGDVRSGLFTAMAKWAVVKSSKLPAAPERTWSPMVLAPISSTSELSGSYRFLKAIAAPQGSVHALGISVTGDRSAFANLDVLIDSFERDRVQARATVIDEDSFVTGVRTATQVLRNTFYRPNILFLNLRPDANLVQLQSLIDRTAAYRMGIVLLSRHPVIDMGRERSINVWISRPYSVDWREDIHAGNKDIALLLAYQLRNNWRGTIQLCTAFKDEEQAEQDGGFLEELASLARLPGDTQTFQYIGPFSEALERAPGTDLTILGLPEKYEMETLLKFAQLAGGSCIFVRDSGEESALA